MVSGHLEGIVSDKKYLISTSVCMKTLSVCISRDFSSSLVIEMYGRIIIIIIILFKKIHFYVYEAIKVVLAQIQIYFKLDSV